MTSTEYYRSRDVGNSDDDCHYFISINDCFIEVRIKQGNRNPNYTTLGRTDLCCGVISRERSFMAM
ncbi:MAG: hypothetical protein IPH22_16380 [Nitrosomonas sp.]|nr:hypothetical protein [Nitrosomonas sp.]